MIADENKIIEKLERIKTKITADNYMAAKRLIQICACYCKGKGYFNQITAKRLKLYSNMTEEDMIAAFEQSA